MKYDYCPNCNRKRWLVWIIGGDWKCNWCGYRIWEGAKE